MRLLGRWARRLLPGRRLPRKLERAGSPEVLRDLGIELLRREGVPDPETLGPLFEPAVFLRFVGVALEREDAELPRAASKVGGRPDLPPDFDWPRSAAGPYRFLAQLNLPDLVGPAAEHLLPSMGLLSFFSEDDRREEARACSVVLHRPGTRLERRDPEPDPRDADAGRRPVHRLTPHDGVTLPIDPATVRVGPGPEIAPGLLDDWDHVRDTLRRAQLDAGSCHQLLGWQSVATDHRLATAARLTEPTEWRLLLELSDGDDRISFFGPEEDLADGRFDRVVAVGAGS